VDKFLRVVLDLEVEGAEPVKGSVCAGDSEARRFSGWIELIGILEELRNTGVRAGAAADQR
jgi:hypothetical protein